MEDLLNALWLLLSLATVWLWLRHWSRVSKYSFPVQLCSLTCALIILFPVVSANDDLYLERMAIETSENRKTSNVGPCVKLARQHFHPHVNPPALPQNLPTARHDAVLAMVATSVVSLLIPATSFLPSLNRPPPRLFRQN